MHQAALQLLLHVKSIETIWSLHLYVASTSLCTASSNKSFKVLSNLQEKEGVKALHHSNASLREANRRLKDKEAALAEMQVLFLLIRL